ncbi:MAG TPA: hypothetical protein PLB25_18490 [Rhodoferax sp.]|nr:hypothetical protein [Rhodoferax sp.]
MSAGINLGYTERSGKSTASGIAPTNLFLGGLQMMWAYRMAQLAGDRLAHTYDTYIYHLPDGGLLRQKTYAGMVLEAGDAWSSPARAETKRNGTLFFAVDSKIGDI